MYNIVLFFSCIFSFLHRTNATKPIVYNAALLGCTWDDLIKKSRRASWTFPYPTFGIRGMTSIESLYWILVLLLEWLPSLLCDIIFGLCGRKQRYHRHEIYREISRVTNLYRHSFMNVGVLLYKISVNMNVINKLVHGKNDFAKGFKILLDLKIILLEL